MKKVLVLLLVLAFGATLVSAEGVSFGAWTRSIYNIASGTTDPASPDVMQSFGPNWFAGGNSSNNGSGNGTVGLYASLSLNVQGPVLGYHIAWETEGGQLNTVPGHFLNFNVSVNLIADMLTMSIGKIANDQFRLDKDANDFSWGDTNWLMGRFETSGRSSLTNQYLVDTTTMGLAAVQLVFAPKDSGLAIGVYMPLNQGGSKFSTDVDNLFIGASYNIASVGKITLVSTPNANGDFYYGSSFTRTYNLGFELTGVKGLDVLVAGGYLNNRNDTTGKSDGIAANIAASVNIDIFSMGVAAYLVLPMATNPTNQIRIDTNPAVNLGVVSVGDSLRFDLTLPSAGASTTAWENFVWVSINPISVKLGFDIAGSSAAGSFINWKIPVSVDLGF